MPRPLILNPRPRILISRILPLGTWFGATRPRGSKDLLGWHQKDPPRCNISHDHPVGTLRCPTWLQEVCQTQLCCASATLSYFTDRGVETWRSSLILSRSHGWAGGARKCSLPGASDSSSLPVHGRSAPSSRRPSPCAPEFNSRYSHKWLHGTTNSSGTDPHLGEAPRLDVTQFFSGNSRESSYSWTWHGFLSFSLFLSSFLFSLY